MVNILVVDDEKEQNQIICKFLMKNNQYYKQLCTRVFVLKTLFYYYTDHFL